MKDRSIASKVAIGFFVIWFAILLAGADFPPPTGFLWIILLDLVAALLVYVRVPSYVTWFDSRRRGRLLLALRDGLVGGLIFAFAAILLPGVGEPSLPPPGLVDHLIWFAVVGAVGAVNAGVIYCVIYVSRRCRREQQTACLPLDSLSAPARK